MFMTSPVQVVFSADEAVRRCKDGEKVILVRIETSPDDIHGLHAAEGVLTTRGWSFARRIAYPRNGAATAPLKKQYILQQGTLDDLDLKRFC